MDVSAIAQSTDAVNQIMQMASKENIEMAEKLVKVTLQLSLGAEAGKGGMVDTTA
jgi:hypothetical protein